jgi:hypothetical protein
VDMDLRTRAHGMKKHGNNTKDVTESKLCARELRHDGRKEETDLKRKRLSSIVKSKGPGCNFAWAATRAYK